MILGNENLCENLQLNLRESGKNRILALSFIDDYVFIIWILLYILAVAPFNRLHHISI